MSAPSVMLMGAVMAHLGVVALVLRLNAHPRRMRRADPRRMRADRANWMWR